MELRICKICFGELELNFENFDRYFQKGKFYYRRACKACERIRQKVYTNIPEVREKVQKRQRTPKYIYKNKEWKKRNEEKVRDSAKKYQTKKRSQIEYKIRQNISRGILRSLKRNELTKNNSQWETLVGYTTSELKSYIQSLFLPNMTWENWGRGEGKWNIDHKRPASWFIFNSVTDSEFKACWALSNLQPMWEIDNKKKSNRFDGGYDGFR